MHHFVICILLQTQFIWAEQSYRLQGDRWLFLVMGVLLLQYQARRETLALLVIQASLGLQDQLEM